MQHSIFHVFNFFDKLKNVTSSLMLLPILCAEILLGQNTVAWEFLGGPISESPAVCSWAQNRFGVFVRGTDNTLWTKYWDGTQWGAFSQLGSEQIASDPAAVSWGQNRVDVFVRGTDNMLYTKSWDGTQWTGYKGLGGPIKGGPAVCSWAANRLDVFVRGTDDALLTKSWNGSQWTGFVRLGKEKISSDPAAVAWGPNRIDVFARGTDNMLYTKSWNGTKWTNYTGLGGPIEGGPAVCSQAANRLDVFVRGTDNTLQTKSWDGNKWGDFSQLGSNKITSDPAAVSWGPNRLDVFARGTDANLYHRWRDGTVWMPIMLTEEQVYRETSRPEVYFVSNGKKIWVPTPEALLGMGYSWNQVIIVPDHALDHLPRFNIPSASATPGSLIFPPGFKPLGNLDASHYPIKIETSTKVKSQGLEVQLAEIRGWLVGGSGAITNGMGNIEHPGTGSDYSFDLIPDCKWLKDNNIDVNKIIRVGNIAFGEEEYGRINDPFYGTTAKKKVSIPLIHVEVNSWLWRDRKPPLLASAPNDWIKIPILDASGSVTRLINWPFVPPNLQGGQYVSVFGSLVTDDPHTSNPVWAGRVDRWAPTLLYSPQQENHYGRYTEIHPADLVQPIVNNPRIQTEITYGLLLCADLGETNDLFCVLYPGIKPSSGLWRVAYEEILGPECRNPTNNSSNHFTRITKYNDRIQVEAKTRGGDVLSGIGRIRALYRVWWEAIP